MYGTLWYLFVVYGIYFFVFCSVMMQLHEQVVHKIALFAQNI